jgi:hypothetical protein
MKASFWSRGGARLPQHKITQFSLGDLFLVIYLKFLHDWIFICLLSEAVQIIQAYFPDIFPLDSSIGHYQETHKRIVLLDEPPEASLTSWLKKTIMENERQLVKGGQRMQ